MQWGDMRATGKRSTTRWPPPLPHTPTSFARAQCGHMPAIPLRAFLFPKLV